MNEKVKEILTVLQGVSEDEARKILDNVTDGLKIFKQPTIVDQILIDKVHEECCGMKYCPFHRWAKVTNPYGAVDSVCELPGDGGNVLQCYPYNDNERTIRIELGENVITCPVKRLPKCLILKPITDKKICTNKL